MSDNFFNKFSYCNMLHSYLSMWLLGIPLRSLMSDEDCGVLTEPLRFGAEKCENKLPFICEKNDEQAESLG